MRKAVFVVVALLALAGTLAFGQNRDVRAAPSDDSEIRRLLTEYAKARERGDGSAQAQFYAEDADEWRASTRKMVTGRAEIAKDLALAPNPARKFRLEIETLQFIAPNVSLVDVSYFGSAPNPNGHATYILVKREDKWLIRAARAVRYPEAKP